MYNIQLRGESIAWGWDCKIPQADGGHKEIYSKSLPKTLDEEIFPDQNCYSVSGQDAPNPALWLATRAGKMAHFCPSELPAVARKKRPRKKREKPGMTLLFAFDLFLLFIFPSPLLLELHSVSSRGKMLKKMCPFFAYICSVWNQVNWLKKWLIFPLFPRWQLRLFPSVMCTLLKRYVNVMLWKPSYNNKHTSLHLHEVYSEGANW